jgi:hypothetical protein
MLMRMIKYENFLKKLRCGQKRADSLLRGYENSQVGPTERGYMERVE